MLGAELVPLGPGRFAYAFGDQRLNVHGPGTDAGDLVARDPVRPGNSDLCLEWAGPAEEAVEHLRRHGVEVEAGPSDVGEHTALRIVERDGAVENATLAGKFMAAALATYSGRLGGSSSTAIVTTNQA